MLHCVIYFVILVLQNVATGSLMDTHSFLAPDSHSEMSQHEIPASEIKRNAHGIIDTQSFLSNSRLVLRMGRSRSMPGSPDVYDGDDYDASVFAQAMAAVASHLFPTAIDILEGLVTRQPRNSNFHFNLGVCHQQAGHLSRALQAYQTALQLQPRETRALLNFGVLVQSMRDFELAATTYRYIIGYIEVTITVLNFIVQHRS